MLIRVLLVLLATTGMAFSQSYGSWNGWTNKDDFTDELTVGIITQSKEYVSCGRRGSRNAPLELKIWCKNNTTSLIFGADHCYFDSSTTNIYAAKYDVKYRIDNLPAKEHVFNVSASNGYLGIWEGIRPISLIKELIGSNKVIMQASRYNKKSETVTFSLKGFDKKIKKIRKACNW